MTKREKFEKNVECLQKTIDKYSNSFVELEYKSAQNTKEIEDLKQEKTGIENFNILRNKIFRKVDELEQNNKHNTKEVFHMEKYIRSLAFSIGGHSDHTINPYSLSKYYFAVEEIEDDKKKIKNWQKTRDEMFEVIQHIDEAFDHEIAEDQEIKERRKSLIFRNRENKREFENSKEAFDLHVNILCINLL